MDDSKASILIVDDKPEKLLAIEAVLDGCNLNIVRAYSGREALRQVLIQDFAVILLDVNMPDMDGFETAQLIRQRKSSSHVPIIFLTAMSDEMHVARGYSLGAVDYMLTPVVPQVLRTKVMVFVDLFRMTDQVKLQAEHLRRRASQLHRLTSASLSINSAPSVPKIAQTAAETARDLIGAHLAMIFVSVARHPEHSMNYGSYSDKYSRWISTPPVLNDSSPLQTMIASTDKPMRMTQAELEAHAPLATQSHDIPPLRGLLCVSLMGRDGSRMGWVILSDKTDGEFNDDDQAVLVQLAQMAAVAMENAIYAEEREGNRLKDEFLSTLSHELRTPLSAISGWVQLLKMDPTHEVVSHGIQVIERNVSAQTKLIEDLLDLSRIASGKLRLNVRASAITPIVEAAVDALRPVVQEKGISLHTQFEASEATVMGDPDRLQQVFCNLLTNAVKFTPSGGQITVRLRGDGQVIRLSVVDTGDGIDPKFLPHVFDRFRQADSTSSRRHGGLGIGLTIVQQIVSLHHGTISAHSEGKGLGSTFTVTLPLAETAAEPGARAAPFETPGGVPASLRDVRVLVVDDEPDCREVVAEMLQRLGAEVAVAASVSDALRSLPIVRPDVILTDLAMPEQDGYALLREVRRLGKDNGGTSAVIALTAYARPEDRERAYESGFQGYIAKPPDPAALAGMILGVAEESAAARLSPPGDGLAGGRLRLHA